MMHTGMARRKMHRKGGSLLSRAFRSCSECKNPSDREGDHAAKDAGASSQRLSTAYRRSSKLSRFKKNLSDRAHSFWPCILLHFMTLRGFQAARFDTIFVGPYDNPTNGFSSRLCYWNKAQARPK